jgi:hypothetical protein
MNKKISDPQKNRWLVTEPFFALWVCFDTDLKDKKYVIKKS